ncbi:MAG: portal protein [Akkermansia sp.]
MDYIKTSEALIAEMQTHTDEWDWLRKHILPRSQANADQEQHPSTPFLRRHSTVACDSLHTFAGACMMYITPAGQKWFALKSDKKGKNKRAIYDDWFAKATEITHEQLGKSNFYTAIHELYLDWALTGVGCLFTEKLPDATLNFTHIPTGTYSASEGQNGKADTLARLFKRTAHQAVQQFGYNKLPQKIRDAYDDDKRRYTEKHQYLHLVLPRTNPHFGHDLINPLKMKWASVYIAWDTDKTIIEESGYNEFPYFTPRFLKFGENFFGTAPGSNVKEEIEACLKLERIMDTLGEIAAFPRLITLAEQVGEIDMRAGGKTVVKPQAAQLQLPREWATSGRYDIGKDRIADKEEKIRQAYFIPFLRVISNIDRQMTATEVIARQEEQVTAITPSMTLFMSECNTLIHRIFSILFRLGKYPTQDMPDELIVRDQGGSENYELKIPEISYLGKINQAIQRAQRAGGDSYIQNALAYTQATQDPSMIEIINIRKYARFLYENSGAPMDCMRTETELQQIDQQRQTATDQQAQLEAIQTAAKANKDIATAQKQTQPA